MSNHSVTQDTSHSIALNLQLACIWEATARKPGNVHRFRDFDDATYVDFLQSAAAIAPMLGVSNKASLGKSIYLAVESCRGITETNTNLGIVLLLAPLARAAQAGELRTELSKVLAGLDVIDAKWVYDAIRLAKPGGLGRVADQDVAEPPTQTLLEVMTLAADRDMIARQYANGFHDVFEAGAPAILTGLAKTRSLEAAIVFGQLTLMAAYPDTLIGRKRGLAEAKESAERARQILSADWPNTTRSWELFLKFDAWLRAIGHQRNPGTTADLIAASLFVLLQEGQIGPPLRFPWPDGFERR
jgi:triphosphoribosyl-dephospho-CoA synthase